MKIAILGCGKMGSWLAKLLSKEHEVAVYDIERPKANSIHGVSVLDSPEYLEGFCPDMLINSVTLSKTILVFDSALQFIPKKCIICDMTSVKAGLAEYYAKSGFKFASVHPMFGPTFADMGAVKGENAIIISESDAGAKGFFSGLFRALGLNVFEYSFKEHDELMAYSLTTPFVSSLVFAGCLNRTTVPGSTFAKHLAIARGLLAEDDTLLAEILFNDKSVLQIGKINSKLELLKHIIIARDYTEAKRFFDGLRENISGK